MTSSDEPDRRDDERAWDADDLERASENVLDPWPSSELDDRPADPTRPDEAAAEVAPPAGLDPERESEEDGGTTSVEEHGFEEHGFEEQRVEEHDVEEPDAALEEPFVGVVAPEETSAEHAPGELEVPPGYPVLEGEARGARRAVGIVVSRFNGEVTGGLLESALAELEALGVEADSITVMPVPGAFELPLAAMALAKTRRFACIVALGCVIRGDTPHFDYVASEAASGLQLAAIETGVPVAFGVLTLDRRDQAEPRLEKGAEAVRTALEMADLFANLRAAATAR
jgi:6,7-dimethyl-8-ribityllumazine synthase